MREEAVNLFVSNLRKWKRTFCARRRRLFFNFSEGGRQFLRDLSGAKLDQAKTGSVIEDDDEENPPNYGDMDALFGAFVREGRKLVLTNQLSHSARSCHISSDQRSQTGGVHITQFPMNGNLLAVLVD